jgi:hypothetical protein
VGREALIRFFGEPDTLRHVHTVVCSARKPFAGL